MKKVILITCMVLLGSFSMVFAAEEKTDKKPPVNYMEAMNQKTITECTSILTNHPDDAIVYCKRGKAYSSLKKDDLAMADFNKAIEINPQYTYAYFVRGVAYEKQNNVDAAIDDLNKAIDLDAQYRLPYTHLGNLYIKNGQNDLAITVFKKAIKNNPDEFQFYLELAKVYEQQRLYAEAINVYSIIVKKNELLGQSKNLEQASSYFYNKMWVEQAKYRIIELGGHL